LGSETPCPLAGIEVLYQTASSIPTLESSRYTELTAHPSLLLGRLAAMTPKALTLSAAPEHQPRRATRPATPNQEEQSNPREIESRPILRTRIPRELREVFLASQRGELVNGPPSSGVACRIFGRRKKNNSPISFGKDTSTEFSARDPPMAILGASSRQRRCRWSSQSGAHSNSSSMPPKPRRASDLMSRHIEPSVEPPQTLPCHNTSQLESTRKLLEAATIEARNRCPAIN
jgi:hypothetical protein